MNTRELIDEILRREGGYVNHPADRGGPTKYGITMATLQRWRKKGVSAHDVETLTGDEARRIYEDLYVIRPGFDGIADDELRALVVDCGVNHGVMRASQWLQEAAGVTMDGIVGPKTLAAVNETNPAELYRSILASRVRFYGYILHRDHRQTAFAMGWMNRLSEFIQNAP